MTITAPIDVNTPREDTTAQDDIVVLGDAISSRPAPRRASAYTSTYRDPAMWFVYIGILSLFAIILTAALLAL